MTSNSIPLQSLSATSASSTVSTGNVQNVSSPSSPAATSQSSTVTTSPPFTSSTSTTQVLSSTPVPSTAAPNVPSQPLHVTLGRIIFGNINGVNASGYILTVVGVIWAIKSYQVAALANTIAQEEVCRNHPSDPAVQAKALCTQMRSNNDFDHQPLERRKSNWTVLLDPPAALREFLSHGTALMNDPASLRAYYAWVCVLLVKIVIVRPHFLHARNRTVERADGWVTVAVKLTSGGYLFSLVQAWLYAPATELETRVIEEYHRLVSPAYGWPFGDSTYYFAGCTIVQMEREGGLDDENYVIRPACASKRNQRFLRDLRTSDMVRQWVRRKTFPAILVQPQRKTPIMKLLYALDVILLASYYIRVYHIPDMVEGLGEFGILQLLTMSLSIRCSADQAFPIRPRLTGWRKLVYGGNCLTLAAYILNYQFVPMGQKVVDAASCFVIQVAYRIVYFRSPTLWGEAYLLLQAWLLILALLDIMI